MGLHRMLQGIFQFESSENINLLPYLFKITEKNYKKHFEHLNYLSRVCEISGIQNNTQIT